MRSFILCLVLALAVITLTGLLAQSQSEISRLQFPSVPPKEQNHGNVGSSMQSVSQSTGSSILSPPECPISSPNSILKPRPIPLPIYGITIEQIENYLDDRNRKIKPVIESLKLSYVPTVRLIFNRWKNADDELKAYQRRPKSFTKTISSWESWSIHMRSRILASVNTSRGQDGMWRVWVILLISGR
jgi:hypothetical protein